MSNLNNEDKRKIVLPDELQKEMMRFFMKTSIPRIAKAVKEKRKNKTLSESEGEGQETKC